MTACSAINCTNRSEQGFKMKRFPQDPALRKIYESKAKKITDKEKVHFCEEHFEDDQWMEIYSGRRILKRFAIPTIFRDNPIKVKAPEEDTTMEDECETVIERNRSMANSHNVDGSAESMPNLRPQCKFVKRTKWSNNENEKLIQLVKLYGVGDWKKISKNFNRRTDLQCKLRWQKLVNLRVVKKVTRPWTEEEDDKLKELVEKYGPEKWDFIAHHLEGRIGRHCKDRWTDTMNPAPKRKHQKTKISWSTQERNLLCHGYKLYGSQWSRIAKLLPGRTQNAVKCYWNLCIRRNTIPGRPGRPKRKYIDESTLTIPKSENQESLQRSDSKLAAGPKRRGRPKSMLKSRDSLLESSAFNDSESEPKNLRILLNKNAVGSSKKVPSAITEISEGTGSSSDYESIPAYSVDLQRENLQSTENNVKDRIKENIIVQSPSPRKLHQLSENVPAAITARSEKSDLSSTYENMSVDDIENIKIKKKKIATASNMDIIIENVHSLNYRKPFLPNIVQDTENEINSCLLYEDPEDNVGKTSIPMSENKPVLFNDVPMYHNEVQLQSPLSEAEDLPDININLTTSQNDLSCSSTEANCSSSVTDVTEEVPINQPQCSLQTKSKAHYSLVSQKLSPEILQENKNHDCNSVSSLHSFSSGHSFEENVNPRFTGTSQTSNFLPSTSLQSKCMKRKKCQNLAHSLATAPCPNSLKPVHLEDSSQSHVCHTPENLISVSETFKDNQHVSQNDFESRVNSFFSRVQGAKHTYEMICSNALREFEKLVSEAAVSNSSDLGEFNFMKPFLETHQSNSKSFNASDIMKLFFVFFGGKIDTGIIKKTVSAGTNKSCCTQKLHLHVMQPSTSSEGQTSGTVQRGGGSQEHEAEASKYI